MASDMTAPSRVIRSASHRGTWPPWRGKSALPARRVITLMCLLEFAGRQTGMFMLRPVEQPDAESLLERLNMLAPHRRRHAEVTPAAAKFAVSTTLANTLIR